MTRNEARPFVYLLLATGMMLMAATTRDQTPFWPVPMACGVLIYLLAPVVWWLR